MTIRIVLAEDQQIVREAFKAVLERDGFMVVGEAGDGHEAVRLVRDLRPDVAVLDIAMPLLNGIDAATQIMKESPDTRTILLTMYSESHLVIDALRAGVKGYLLKTRAVADLEQAIREVCRGAVYLSSGISRESVEAFLEDRRLGPHPLSPRERQVIQLVAEGKSTKEVANLLGISVKTAESHRSRIMEKLDIHETASLVRYAIRKGIIQP